MEHFSADELENLAFYLGIDSGELGDGAKSVRIGRLIDMVYHQQKAGMLIWRIKELRPHLNWQD